MDKPTQQSLYPKAINMYREQNTDETVFPVVNSAKNDINPTPTVREQIVLTIVVIGVILMGIELYTTSDRY